VSYKKAPRTAGAGLQGIDPTAGAIDPGNNADDLARQRLELFAVRCRQMAERVNAGAAPFIWAVDCLYEAAVWSGLADDLGDDAVQATMAAAFMGARRT
jgi:hypothetical protein